MKVTKLVDGYRIRLNNSEFEALKVVAMYGAAKWRDDKAIGRTLTGRTRSVLNTGRFAHPEGPLGVVDEVKREDVARSEAAE